MSYHNVRNSRGVALLAALFVLMILSILGIWLLFAVTDEQRLSKSAENSERALKIAEAGIQIARSTFADSGLKNITSTMSLSAVDGFYRGGYFLAQLESGFQGAEKWKTWRFDEGATGNNALSQITAPVFHVWQTGAKGVNGTWSTDNTLFYINPIYPIVARGTYFSIEKTGNTLVRAHDEYTGNQKVDSDPNLPGSGSYTWIEDKSVTTTATPKYAVSMSPMASFSNYSTPSGTNTQPELKQQTLYFAYSGSDTDLSASGTADRSSTVRLRAVNALCHGTSPYAANNAPMATLWEFDTKVHGVGTAPAFFDPIINVIVADATTTPPTKKAIQSSGDEVIYFAVIGRGKAGSPGALNLKAAVEEIRAFPARAVDDPAQIYLFALIDTSPRQTSCTTLTGSYKVKWARPFPDPDVVEWTDYPTEHATGTTGQDEDPANRGASYIRSPADMAPFLPEDDLLVDYRDGPGIGLNVRSGVTDQDGQWNQMRGKFAEEAAGVSPPVLKVLYRKTSGKLTENAADPEAADPVVNPADPIIDIYLMYSMMTRMVAGYNSNGWLQPWYWESVTSPYGTGWGPPGYRKLLAAQTRVVALRDRLARGASDWNWKSAKSRYPTLKWNYRAPAWDPDQASAAPDGRPWNGYGEYTWDAWFTGQIAPMVMTFAWDQDGTGWTAAAGKENLYTVIYPYYKSAGFFHGGAYINEPGTGNSGRNGPSVALGAPKDFSSDALINAWADTRVMTMAIRDTWDDYMKGATTNILGQNLAKLNLGLSNPVEPYWTHTDVQGVGGTGALDFTTAEKTLVTYNATINAPYRTNTAKVGWPRPYAWWERLWIENVRADANDGLARGLKQQGWAGVVGTTAKDVSLDIDVEGASAAICAACQDDQGLLVLPFNHDLASQTTDRTSISTAGPYYSPSNSNTTVSDREDLRFHAINATTGLHVWDYHIATFLKGTDANNAPAIANNLVFAAYEKFGSKTTPATNNPNRQARMVALDVTTGEKRQDMLIDGQADAVIMAPTIANGAVYVGTYSFGEPRTLGSGSASDNDVIRLFAMSPVIRLVSTGIYPFDYKNYTGGGFKNITMLDHDKIFMNPTGGEPNRPAKNAWIRKLQVWVTGQNSKWEEVREVLKR